MIATNVKLNLLYIADQRDEIQFLKWILRIIHPILSRDNEEQQQQRIIKKRLEIIEMIEFENTLQERVEELNLKLKELNNLMTGQKITEIIM
jgi:hypothetical protein